MCEDQKKIVINISGLGKMYKLYKKNSDKVRDAFGLNFWRKNYYQEYWALRDINIQINRGERVGLIGHNGAGKSTLLKMIIGNLEPTEGNLKINGKIQALMELGTGFHPDFTGIENIRTSLAYNGLSQLEIRKKEEEIIDFAELGDYINQPVKTYSAGMYARLAFSTATAIEPEVLIIDEVLGVGDAYFTGKSIERMKKLTSNENTTVLFVSHDLGSVQALCDRVIWIDKGRVRYDGDPLTAIKRYSDTIRDRQENKLRVRDRKVQKKQAVILDKEEELYRPLLFRINGSEEFHARIRKVELFQGERCLAEINVGSPMDNNLGDYNHILDEKSLMCWCASEKDSSGYFRRIDSTKGKYQHAPFVLTIGKSEDPTQVFSLKLSGEIESGSGFELSLYDKTSETYRLIYKFNAEVPLEMQAVTFQIDTTAMPEKIEEIEFQDSDRCRIVDAGIYDRGGIKRRVFSFSDSVSFFAFQIRFSDQVEKFSFAFLIFSIRGDIIISQCQDVTGGREKEYEVRIDLGDLRLGPGMYTISFGIYDEIDVRDNSKPQSAIALIDRGISFEIESPIDYQLNLGYIVSELKTEVSGRKGQSYLCSSKI